MLRDTLKAIFFFAMFAMLICLLIGRCGHAQERQTRKVDFALYAADASIRALDLASTRALLASPCRCFAEDDPLAPGTGRLAPLAGFQAGLSFAAMASSRRLALRGHPRLGRLLLAADISGEVWAVQHNYRQSSPPLPAERLTPTPRTAR